MKNNIIAIVVLFVAWSAIDFVVHGQLLASAYEATASLWRPVEEMKAGLMSLVTLLIAIVFVFGYAKLVAAKSLVSGVHYGLAIGLVVALGFGFGTYGYMPIPMSMALTWFCYAVVSYLIGGAIVGKLVKE